jgi:endonuclease YncB( thermonuclease family)
MKILVHLCCLVVACLMTIMPTRAAPADHVGQARVVDGDTIEIGTIRIRFFGIDAPEIRQTCLNAAGQRYNCGQLSKQYLAGLIGSHTVTCQDLGAARVGDRRWGRCFANGVNLQAAMVSAGHAKAFGTHSAEYVGLEQEARNKKHGIWQGAYTNPAAVRKCKRGGKTAKECS